MLAGIPLDIVMPGVKIIINQTGHFLSQYIVDIQVDARGLGQVEAYNCQRIKGIRAVLVECEPIRNSGLFLGLANRAYRMLSRGQISRDRGISL